MKHEREVLSLESSMMNGKIPSLILNAACFPEVTRAVEALGGRRVGTWQASAALQVRQAKRMSQVAFT
jgi:hypothetical protein